MAATPISISASNVTMPASGNGVTHYTVSGSFLDGTLEVICVYSGPATTAHIPTCTYGPSALLPVQPGQTVTGTIQFYPYGVGVPAAETAASRHGGFGWPAGGIAAAGLLLGLRLRRRAPRWLLCLALSAVSLAGAMAITACGSGNGMTPGVYAYTITATNRASNSALSTQTSTTINVTVP